MGRHSGFLFGLSITAAVAAGLLASGLDLSAGSGSDAISKPNSTASQSSPLQYAPRIRSFYVPRNSLIVLTSLDRTGAPHSFQVRGTESSSSNHVSPRDAIVPIAATDNAPSVKSVLLEAHRELSPRLPPEQNLQLDARLTYAEHAKRVNVALANSFDQLPGHQAAAGTLSRARRRFLAPRYEDTGITETLVDASLLASSGSVAFYVDTTLSVDQQTHVRANLEHLMAVQIDVLAFLLSTRLGTIHDLDHDGQLSILITELDCQDDRAVPVLGCVRPSDFLGACDESSSELAELSDVVYLDAALSSKADLAALLAHELSHAAVYCRLHDRRMNKQAPLELPEWMHEGIAHLQEPLSARESSVFLERQALFYDAPSRSPVCPNPIVSSRAERRGGSRVAVTRFLQFALRPEQQWGQWLSESEDFDSLLTSCLRDNFDALIADWTLCEAMEIDRRSPQSINSVLPSKPVNCEILGTAFAVLRTGDHPLEVVVECSDRSAWTVMHAPRPADQVTTQSRRECFSK